MICGQVWVATLEPDGRNHNDRSHDSPASWDTIDRQIAKQRAGARNRRADAHQRRQKSVKAMLEFPASRGEQGAISTSKQSTYRSGSITWTAWWAVTGSNRRPSRCKRDALPAELTALVPRSAQMRGILSIVNLGWRQRQAANDRPRSQESRNSPEVLTQHKARRVRH